jgi:D-xylose transport system permease protein
VFQVADRLAVLYLGRLVTSGPASDYDTASAVDLITTGASQRAHHPSDADGETRIPDSRPEG